MLSHAIEIFSYLHHGEVLQSHQLMELGKLTSELMHEISNPLTIATGNLELAVKEEAKYQGSIGPERKLQLDTSLACLKQIHTLVSTSQKQVQQQDDIFPFSLNQEIFNVLQLYKLRAQRLKVTLSFTPTREDFLAGNHIKFTQIISNLVTNALDAYEEFPTQKQKKIAISVQKTRQHFVIKITDFGPGISPTHLRKIFRSYFTTKTSQHGTGLGLSITKQIIEQNFGGHIFVESVVGKGTTFRVQLPISLPKKPKKHKKWNLKNRLITSKIV